VAQNGGSMNEKEALIVIDMTNDFVDDRGSLTVGKPAQEIIPYILELCKKFRAEGKLIFFMNDCHEEDEAQFASGQWPKHCIRTTWGQKLCRPLYEWFSNLGDYDGIVDEYYIDNTVLLTKTAYDAFFATELDVELNWRGIEKVHLVGVCTDICVFATALGAYANELDVVIHDKGCATFTKNHKAFLEHMKLCCKAEIV
jgi:nicotinamidase-related amidase